MKHPPLYREALSNSWKLVWSHKLLLVFGLFAAFLGQMGIFEIIANLASVGSVKSGYIVGYTESLSFASRVGTGLQSINLESGLLLFWMWLILFALIVGFGYVAVVSQGALIKSVALFAKKNKVPDIAAAWHSGVKHFWRLLFIQIIRKLILFLVMLALGIAAYNASTGGDNASAFLYVGLFLLAAIVGIVLSFLSIYAAGYVVVEEYSLGEGIHAAWCLFVDHWLVSLEIAGILFLLNILLIGLGLAGVLLFFSPAAILWIITAATGVHGLFVAGFVVSVTLVLFFIMFLGSVFTCFSTSVWTYLFMKMHREGIASRIVHWMN